MCSQSFNPRKRGGGGGVDSYPPDALSLIQIWWVISRIGSPNLPLRFEPNLGDPKIRPWEPLLSRLPHPEFES